jgi:hypothetical protein
MELVRFIHVGILSLKTHHLTHLVVHDELLQHLPRMRLV